METETEITKVEQDLDTGWFTIHAADGKKYATKIAEKAHEAQGLRGSKVILHYDERTRESNGRTYNNRYYDRATAMPAGPSSNGGIEQVAGSRRTPPQDAWRMCLNKGGELAVATLPLMPNEQRGFEIQKQIAIAWAKFFFYTPLPEGPTGKPPSDPDQAINRDYIDQAQAAQAASYENDDDIPF